MTKRALKVLFGFLFIIFCSARAQDPQKAKMTSYGIGYLEYLPDTYSLNTNLYPAIIFLHGAGERGTGSATDLELVKKNGPPNLIKNGNTMCFTANGRTECFIVLSPQTIKWSWGYDVVPFVKYALANYRIDPDRVYVTGLSMGGQGTWFAGSFSDNNPNYFAAMAPMSAKATITDGVNVAGKHIPVWAFHGDNDKTISLADGTLPITGMLESNASPAPIFTIYPGADHGQTWVKGYTPDHSVQNPNVYEWFLMQRRNSSQSAPPPPPPPALTVSAGPDQSITLPVATVTLNATATNISGTATYIWSKVSGPSATLVNTASASLTVNNLVSGTYTFSVTANDNRNVSVTDNVVVQVNSPSNILPTVNGGPDQVITLPVNATTLTATATDADGTIASFLWTKIGGGAITMSGASSSSLQLSNAVQCTYVFRIQVTDNRGGVAADTVHLKVNGAFAVNAGADQTITLPVSSASFTATTVNPVGTVLYTWSKVSGPSATLSNTTSQKVDITNALAGVYTFRVSIKDSRNITITDDVILNVNPAVTAANLPPTVIVSDQVINLPVNSAVLSASAKDPDGTIASYLWTKIGGGSITMSGTTTSSLTVNNAVTGTYVFQIKVTDNKGATALDTLHFKVNGVLAVDGGVDKIITLPTSTASFKATPVNASQTVIAYTWTKLTGPSIVMSGTSSNTLLVSNAIQGVYVFIVKITNASSQTASDTVKLTVNALAAKSAAAARLNTPDDTNEAEYNLSLEQNYPNPFTSVSVIPFSLDKSKHVVIKVFDATGNEVVTILNDDLAAGNHSVELKSNMLPVSGVYYCKLITDQNIITRRIVFVL